MPGVPGKEGQNATLTPVCGPPAGYRAWPAE